MRAPAQLGAEALSLRVAGGLRLQRRPNQHNLDAVARRWQRERKLDVEGGEYGLRLGGTEAVHHERPARVGGHGRGVDAASVREGRWNGVAQAPRVCVRTGSSELVRW